MVHKNEEEIVYVYRGVHGEHLMLAAALAGTVVPGDPFGELTPEEHNLLDLSGASQFTSWTYSRTVAERFANSRPGKKGVVLRLIKHDPTPDDLWSWHESPDFHREMEVLLKGFRIGAEVL